MKHIKETVTFGSIDPPYWEHRPAIVVGAGPSLQGFDFNQLRGLGHIVAVNGAMYDLPFADAWVTLDHEFVRHNHDFLSQPGAPLYIGLPRNDWVGQRSFAPKVERAIYIKTAPHKDGCLSDDPKVLTQGNTSGYCALNFAYLKRPKLIVLFGFDYTETSTLTHYCPERYTPWRREQKLQWIYWLLFFNAAGRQLERMGVRVINASPTSAITVFERMFIEQALEELQGLQA